MTATARDEFKLVCAAFVQQDRGPDQIPATQRRVADLLVQFISRCRAQDRFVRRRERCEHPGETLQGLCVYPCRGFDIAMFGAHFDTANLRVATAPQYQHFCLKYWE
ncbi:MAG: hypothetical protein WB677_14795 [Xanthobacteraceae bacterium]